MTARRWWAWPLVPIYAAAIGAKSLLRTKPKKLAWPVISVGSLSAGGAGKTPVVLALTELLQEAGHHVDILSRGYGRKNPGTGRSVAQRVDTTLPDAAARFGDEPVLLAQKTGAPVWVAGNRYFAGQTAEYAAKEEPFHYRRSESRPEQTESPSGPWALNPKPLHLLDDGFQHRQLFRNFDIVLLTAADIDDALLPAGNRREPFSALHRADAIVIRDREREKVLPFARQYRRADTALWFISRKLKFGSPLAVLGAGLRPLAFCAIARPADFAAMVQAAGCGLVDTLTFRDHHAYTLADIDEILATARRLNISGFVTTEKDAVKLTEPMLAKLREVGPVLIASLEVEFLHESAVVQAIQGRLG